MLILFFTIPPASASGVSTKKAIKKQRHDKKSRVTTQNLPGTFLFFVLESCRSSIGVSLTPSVKGALLACRYLRTYIGTQTQYSGVDYIVGSTGPSPSR